MADTPKPDNQKKPEGLDRRDALKAFTASILGSMFPAAAPVVAKFTQKQSGFAVASVFANLIPQVGHEVTDNNVAMANFMGQLGGDMLERDDLTADERKLAGKMQDVSMGYIRGAIEQRGPGNRMRPEQWRQFEEIATEFRKATKEIAPYASDFSMNVLKQMARDVIKPQLRKQQEARKAEQRKVNDDVKRDALPEAKTEALPVAVELTEDRLERLSTEMRQMVDDINHVTGPQQRTGREPYTEQLIRTRQTILPKYKE